jgi:5-enolpyruvylshikimate-3-phosphate synthase
MTLAELEAQREALLAALSAPDSVTFGDRSMRHRSPEQIRTALQQVDAEIAKMKAADSAASTPTRVIRTYTSKGF